MSEDYSKLQTEVNHAVDSMPSNWVIEIEIEFGEVTVHLKDPEKVYIEYRDDPHTEQTTAEDVDLAVKYAWSNYSCYEEA